ncbi:hypothetical protein DFJ43DRAFT_1150383 [Lentinula guzmanii]|uniref:Transmembrane protein n=1 Tax=Lentinula guzmanii TaxID=2804957 RepID=A0AA38K024_9AGAR|nr:hypothetical protein DFJ43DRAFT_1150383 [Lentinula guzmanii]
MTSRSVLQNTFLICKFVLSSIQQHSGLSYFLFSLAAASAFGTGIHGILTAQSNISLRVFSAGINGGISGATFFSIREFAVSPLLVATLHFAQYERRRKESDTLENLKWAEIRTDRLLDSAVSGSLTGGILRGMTRNLRGVSSGAISAGLICTLLQYMYNESRIIRLEYLVHQREPYATSSPRNITSNETGTPSRPWTERLLQTIGIRAVSDEEHLIMLKEQRNAHLKRIAEIEEDLKREKGG